MDRSWWWKAALYGFLTTLACLYLVPSVVPLEKQPKLIQRFFTKRIQKGLDLAGGLRLVYTVDMDKAVSAKLDQMTNVLEDNLHKKTKDVSLVREGRDGILVKFNKPADISLLDNEVLAEQRDQLDEVSRDAAAGTVRLRLDPDQVAEIQESSLRQGIETIRGRVDKFGVSEPTIIKKGTDIVVELPGLEQRDFDRIKSIIGRTAQLQFKVVEDAGDYAKKVAATVQPNSGITVVPDSWRDDKTGAQHEVVYLQGKDRATLEKFVAALSGDLAVPNDREWGYEEVAAGEGNTQETTWRSYLLYRRAGVTGEYLADADVGFSEMGTPEVMFTMNRAGGSLMGKLTGDNVGRRMAIVLDDRIMSAPVIQSQINERGRITLGAFGDPMKVQQEAKDLVAVLRSGALPAPLTKSYETQVGRTLGDDAINKAILSMYIGAAAVVLFMLLYYRLCGLIANIAMMLNMLYLVAILAAMEAALTLPGIAGLVLTIGMAVDANIVIYERIREELRAGKSPRAAVDLGFGRAFWTIFDAHVTTFVAGVVLFSYGSGPIRGFAVTMLVGIVANMMTSVWVSRWFFDLIVNRRGHSPATLSI
ncbi:MAG TPA: protein translocase subunit SecD [Polyangia bacterium]